MFTVLEYLNKNKCNIMLKKKIHPKGTIKPTPLLYRPWIVHISYFNSSQVYKTDATNKWKVNKKLSSVQ